MSTSESTPLPKNVKDVRGARFGRLVVTAFAGLTRYKRARWHCVCDCGNEKTVEAGNLAKGHVQSCRCLQKELARERHTTHGGRYTQIYKKWRNMLRRCYAPRDIGYKHYGGRGISVCERWRASFERFYEDMGDPPTPQHTIERKDNNGPYSPENCRWATNQEQQNNTSANRLLVFHGHMMTLSEWSRFLSISPITLHGRLRRGWSIERTLTEPLQVSHSTRKSKQAMPLPDPSTGPEARARGI